MAATSAKKKKNYKNARGADSCAVTPASARTASVASDNTATVKMGVTVAVFA